MIIDIACANTSASGFVANTDTLLANFDLKVERTPEISPLVLRFDPALSVITRKSDNQDILLIPASTGSYSVAGSQQQATATPVPTTALTGTPTPTSRLTATPTSTASATPTLTTQLPDAGVSLPTYFGLGLGVLVIVGALLLAL